MANPWFRLYSEFCDDPKVLMMEEKFRYRLVVLFCARCKFERLTEKEMPIIFRLSMEETLETKDQFIEHGFIDANWKVLNWDKRQFLSDSSKERVRQYRERKQSNVTPSGRYTGVTVTAQDTEQTQSRTDFPMNREPIW